MMGKYTKSGAKLHGLVLFLHLNAALFICYDVLCCTAAN